MCTLTHFVHSLPASHKKNCINEKRRKGKNWAIPFSYLNKDSTLFSYTWFPPFRCYVGKSSQLVFFLFLISVLILSAFQKGRGCTRAIGKSWVHGFEMIQPTYNTHRLNIFFSASFFFSPTLRHQFRSIFSSVLKRPTASAFFRKGGRKNSPTHDIFHLMPCDAFILRSRLNFNWACNICEPLFQW